MTLKSPYICPGCWPRDKKKEKEKAFHVPDLALTHENKCKFLADYLAIVIPDLVKNKPEEFFHRLLNKGFEGWLKPEDFNPIVEELNRLSGSTKLAVTGEQTLQLEMLTRKREEDTQKVKDRRKRGLRRICEKLDVQDVSSILTKEKIIFP